MFIQKHTKSGFDWRSPTTPTKLQCKSKFNTIHKKILTCKIFLKSFYLEKDKKMGISMFERLIINGFKANYLSLQRRMHPSISQLVKPIYLVNQNLELIDHQIVEERKLILETKKSKKNLPNFSSRIFWWTHNQPEERTSVGRSKTNMCEVEMIKNLVHFLIIVNHIDPSSITSKFFFFFFRIFHFL